MKRLVISACLVFAGVVAGWWLRDLAYERTPLHAGAPVASPDVPIAIAQQSATAINPFAVLESRVSPEAASFASDIPFSERDLRSYNPKPTPPRFEPGDTGAAPR